MIVKLFLYGFTMGAVVLSTFFLGIALGAGVYVGLEFGAQLMIRVLDPGETPE